MFAMLLFGLIITYFAQYFALDASYRGTPDGRRSSGESSPQRTGLETAVFLQ
jgi:hypothetical protein